MPLVTIITITYNAQDFILRTLESIKSQTSDNYEYIVVDGKSNDQTLDIIESYKNMVDVLISEKDSGLYDAMNKGLIAAKGRYVWFVNAGDEIAESDAVEKLEKMINTSDPDVIYSDTEIVNERGEVLGLRTQLTPHQLKEGLTWKDFSKGMLICHQSFIVKKSIAPNYIENNLSADIDWEIKCLKAAKSIEAYPGILSKYLEGGLSNKKLFQSWIDRFKVLQYHFGFFSNIFNHLMIVLRPGSTKFLRQLKYIKN